MTGSVLPEGITLAELSQRVRAGEIDIVSLLGETRILLFKPKVGEEEESPVFQTPPNGVALPEPGDTSVLQRGAAGQIGTVLRSAVVVALTTTNRNLYEDRLLVGRAKSCDIRLVSSLVSKLHLTIRLGVEGEQWEAMDQGSSNGTRINGIALEPKRPYRLRINDELVIGDVTALFLDGEALAQLCALLD